MDFQIWKFRIHQAPRVPLVSSVDLKKSFFFKILSSGALNLLLQMETSSANLPVD